MDTFPQATSPELTRPNPEFIDGVIAEYEAARAIAEAADARTREAKDRVTYMTELYGYAVPGAEQSKRIDGRRNSATITRSTTVTVNPVAVTEFEIYLQQIDHHKLFDRLFTRTVKYALREGAQDVLRGFEIGRRVSERIHSLFGKAFEVRTNAPSLKVKLIEPETPVRKGRGKKEAA